MILSFLLALLLLVLACATPQTKAPLIPTENILEEAVLQLEPAFRKTMTKRARIERIASPILSKNAELCKSRMKYGFSYIDSTATSKLACIYWHVPDTKQKGLKNSGESKKDAQNSLGSRRQPRFRLCGHTPPLGRRAHLCVVDEFSSACGRL